MIELILVKLQAYSVQTLSQTPSKICSKNLLPKKNILEKSLISWF